MLYVANRQIKASVLAANRQQWINTLRNELCEYIAMVFAFSLRSAASKEWSEDYANTLKELSRIESKIVLLLNPTESDHAELRSLLYNHFFTLSLGAELSFQAV